MKTDDYEEKTDADTKNQNRSFYLKLIDRYPDRLKDAIDESGYTNTAIAKKAGVSEAVIRKYLRYEALPTLDRAVGLAEACNKPLEWFVSDEPFPNVSLKCNERANEEQTESHVYDKKIPKPRNAIAISYESRMQEIVNVLSRISDTQREDLLNIIYINGISAILSLNDEKNIKFMQLPDIEKEQLLRLHAQIKEGASEGDIATIAVHPTQNQVG